MIKNLFKVKVASKHFVESYCKLKRNELILQRITACM